MAALALAISILALLAASFSAWYTMREAHATEGALAIENRRELERTLAIRFEWLTRDQPYLLVENRGTRELDVYFRIADHHNITPQRGTFGFRDTGDPRLRGLRSLKPGERRGVEFWVKHDLHVDSVNLLAKFDSSGDAWDQVFDVTVPPPPPNLQAKQESQDEVDGNSHDNDRKDSPESLNHHEDH